MIATKKINKFRGKPVGGGEFVYGSLVQAADGVFIVQEGTMMQFEEPRYYKPAMGCGLEDKGITDRYEAMEYGFERAVDKCAELHPYLVEVDPESVGQLLGLLSKSRNEIYEGDIVICRHQKRAKVFWDQEHSCFATETIDEIVKEEIMFCLSDVIEIIGNMHEMPELLRV